MYKGHVIRLILQSIAADSAVHCPDLKNSLHQLSNIFIIFNTYMYSSIVVPLGS